MRVIGAVSSWLITARAQQTLAKGDEVVE